MVRSISADILNVAYPDAASMMISHRTTVAVLEAGGRAATDNPDWLRRLLTRRGLAFATTDNAAGGTTFRLIR
jgi:hypothetical protein